MAQRQVVVLDRAVASITWGAEATPTVDRAEPQKPVERQVITLTQLDFEARVLLINAGGTEAAFAPLDHEALVAGLNAIIDERLVVFEADNLEAYPIEQGELEKAIADFRARFSTESDFRRFLTIHEVDLQDIARVLQRSLRTRRALDGKLRLRVQVAPEEVDAYRASHPELKEVASATLKQRLTNERFQLLVKRELTQLRRAVDVRLLGPFAPSPVEP